MGNPYIWGDLDRANNDGTKIDQAIDEAINAHNDDPDAHLGPTQSLESHRASEIIDHRAESVVNDKIAAIARAYVAIVDPSSDVDFDTIQAAVAYAAGKGGGTIFLASGDHYISGKVDLPMSINFYAADYESCRIHGGFTGGNYFNIVASSPTEQKLMTFENITLNDDGGGIFNYNASTFLDVYTLEFTRCRFTGGGKYIQSRETILRFDRCIVDYGTGPAFASTYPVYFFECTIENNLAQSNSVLVSFAENDYSSCAIWMYDSTVTGTFTTVNPLFSGTTDFSVNIFSSRILNWDYQNASLFTFNLQNCYITGRANRVYTLSSDGNEGVIAFNTILASGTGYILPYGPPLKFLGNYMTGAATHASSNVTILDDMSVDAWIVLANNATVLTMADYLAVQLTPNSTRTVTTNVPRAGEQRTLIILTSGTTSYTMTFGTGFKTTGTLATGATSARRFVINFVSDGTYLIEMSRTTAIA